MPLFLAFRRRALRAAAVSPFRRAAIRCLPHAMPPLSRYAIITFHIYAMISPCRYAVYIIIIMAAAAFSIDYAIIFAAIFAFAFCFSMIYAADTPPLPLPPLSASKLAPTCQIFHVRRCRAMPRHFAMLPPIDAAMLPPAAARQLSLASHLPY